MHRTRGLSIGTACAAAVLLLSGCTAPGSEVAPAATEPGSSAASPPSSAAHSSPTPTATADPQRTGVPAHFAIPECAAQVDDAIVQAAFGADVVLIADTTDTWKPVGPAAQDALAASDDATACLWGVPRSGRAVSIAVVSASEAAPRLIAALRDASDTFTEERSGTATVFTGDAIEAGDVSTAVTYVFDGAAWITVGGGELATPDTTRDVALAVHSALPG
ncbi:hypothetical protein A9Z40_10800 [Microbacterium arborescens]|uniref:Uncharacterized protein n=1 Tax=Microbacterium arborescens TaxID=33883 RepID=A0ABX2WMT9_9MICO|nr:hypothetical protein [Microbacterium arborescens]OAZ44923.1 hypothetical protein A9Z40_10800 [Microbacterium arborescens]